MMKIARLHSSQLPTRPKADLEFFLKGRGGGVAAFYNIFCPPYGSEMGAAAPQK